MSGKTLRLTDTRGVRSWPASFQVSRKSEICSACSSANGAPVSSVSSVELIRFMPCSAVQIAVLRVPAPHQRRSSRPGDCGWIGSLPMPPAMRGSASTTPAPVIAWRKTAVCSRATSASVWPSAGT
jgi:hypothetical protein